MTVCRHCGHPVVVVLLAGLIPYRERWVHVTRFSRHGWRDRPTFVTCPTGTTTATPRPA